MFLLLFGSSLGSPSMVLPLQEKADHSTHPNWGPNRGRVDMGVKRLLCCLGHLHTFRFVGQGDHTILQIQEASLTDILQFTTRLAHFSLLETHADSGAPAKHCEWPGTDL